MKFNYPRACKQIGKNHLISFDIFDTALHRKLSQPSDIFSFMEPEVILNIGLKVPSFAEARVNAENIAKSRLKVSVQQINLADIYSVIQDKYRLSQKESKALQALEIAVEKKFLYANPLILQLYEFAKNHNKRVIFISDMYLPSVDLKDILSCYGYKDPEVFVSAEWNGNKASGRLYRIVQEKIKTPPSQCLHFGDNIYADYFRARINGWQATYVSSKIEDPLNKYSNLDNKNEKSLLTSSLFLGLRQKSIRLRSFKKDSLGETIDFWSRFGYETVGPIYFNFLLWLCQQAKRDNVQRLMLVSRDGYPLMQGFDILRQKWPIQIQTSYLFASRRLFNMAAVQQLTAGAINFLLMPNPGLTLREFILRMDLDPKAHSAALLRMGFQSLDDAVTHNYFGRFVKPEYKLWLESWIKLIQEELLASCMQRRILLQDYLCGMEIDRTDTAIVDIGWKASSSRSLQDIIRINNPNFSLRTYFFGTFGQAANLIREGGKAESFFVHLGEPANRQAMVATCEGLIELLFAAPHGSIVGLKLDTKGIEPIYSRCEYSQDNLYCLQNMREGAYNFIEDAAHLLPSCQNSLPSIVDVDDCLRQLLHNPTKEQASHLGQMPYRVSYGDENQVRLFAQPLNKKEWMPSFAESRRFGEAPWKKGFLKQTGILQALFLQIIYVSEGLYAAISTKTLSASLRWVLSKK